MHEPNKHQSNNSLVQNWWNTLWSLPIPPNIRVFWWKIFHNLITIATNLANHHVPVSRWCYFCHNSEETCHALFFCPAVRHLWKENVVWRQIKNHKNCDTHDICFWLLMNTSRVELVEFCYQAWLVWKE